jgi:hypothetical protein
MKQELVKKIGKWVLIMSMGSIVLVGIVWFAWGSTVRYWNHKSTHKDDFRPGMGGKSFFFGDRDCNEMVNVSNEEIKKIIIEKYSSDDYYRNRVNGAREEDLSSLRHDNAKTYELKGSELELKKEMERCIDLEDRILKVFNEL